VSNNEDTLVDELHVVFLTNNAARRTLFFYFNRSVDEMFDACTSLPDLRIISDLDIEVMTPQEFSGYQYRPLELPANIADAKFVNMTSGAPEQGSVIEIQLVDDSMFVSAMYTIAVTVAEYFDVVDYGEIVLHRHYGDPQPHTLDWLLNVGSYAENNGEVDTASYSEAFEQLTRRIAS